MIGLQGDRLIVAGERCGKVARIAQQVAAVEIQCRISRLQGDRPVVRDERLRVPSQFAAC